LVNRTPFTPENIAFLRGLARDVVEASRVWPGQSVAGSPPNTTGATLIRPGGRDCYPAFWIRDFAMSLDSGLITTEELEHALLLTAHLQADADWHTPSGSLVPRGAVADHITFDGLPIFFPGTLDYEAQGQPWGYYPSLDDHFYFVEMAYRLAVGAKRPAILYKPINGVRLLERLALAFSVPTADEDSGLVWCDEQRRGVSFGFTDSIIHTGRLLFCSILRWQAARQLQALFALTGESHSAVDYGAIAERISASLPEVFRHPSGLLAASTGKSAQPDVWGSAYAVYTGALTAPESQQVAAALLRAYRAGTIAWQGNIRHVPVDWDFSPASAWEQTTTPYPKNTYQNGAYWNTPTGWVCYALALVDTAAALELASEYLRELQAGDYRQGAAYGSPYECIHPQDNYHQNPVYMTSVTCPLAAFQRLGWI